MCLIFCVDLLNKINIFTLPDQKISSFRKQFFSLIYCPFILKKFYLLRLLVYTWLLPSFARLSWSCIISTDIVPSSNFVILLPTAITQWFLKLGTWNFFMGTPKNTCPLNHSKNKHFQELFKLKNLNNYSNWEYSPYVSLW